MAEETGYYALVFVFPGDAPDVASRSLATLYADRLVQYVPAAVFPRFAAGPVTPYTTVMVFTLPLSGAVEHLAYVVAARHAIAANGVGVLDVPARQAPSDVSRLTPAQCQTIARTLAAEHPAAWASSAEVRALLTAATINQPPATAAAGPGGASPADCKEEVPCPNSISCSSNRLSATAAPR